MRGRSNKREKLWMKLLFFIVLFGIIVPTIAPGSNWGNGSIEGDEECDDGNNYENDGWDQNCKVEPNYICTGAPSTCVINTPEWGNGKTKDTEEWDDGNTEPNDGCSSTWNLEVGWSWNTTQVPSNWTKNCGNGSKNDGEECDDGNQEDADGCTPDCRIEPGWVCNNFPSRWERAWGNTEKDDGEECDDGNRQGNDGCSSTWQIEEGWTCFDKFPAVCEKNCGNGIVENGESWDDGNTNDEDGCSGLWEIESGYSCKGAPSDCTIPTVSPPVVSEICGNGIIKSPETCDDGNNKDEDGWSSQCTIDDFYECKGEPSVWKKAFNKPIASQDSIIGNSIGVTIGATFITSMILCGLLNLSTKGLWSLINVLQILNFLPMFTLFYSQNVLSVFGFTALANMNFSYLSDLFLLHVNEDELSNKEAVNYRYENQGYESTSLLLNCADAFAFLIVLALYEGIMVIIYFLIKKSADFDKSGDPKSFMAKYAWRFSKNEVENIWLNTIIRVGLEIYLEITFSSWLNIKTLDFGNNMEIYSSSLSVLWAIGSLAFTIVILGVSVRQIIKHRREIQLEDEDTKKGIFDELFGHLKPENKFAPIVHIFFLLQRVLIIGLILGLQDSGVLQIVVFSTLTTIKAMVFVLFRPFKEAKLCFQEFFNEIITLAITLLFIVYKNVVTEFTKFGTPEFVGYVCVALIVCKFSYIL